MAIKLGELLLVNGLISRDQLNKSLKIQTETGKRIGSILVEMGAISEDMLLKILTDKFGVSTIDLNNFVIQDNIINLLPGDFCRKNQILPVDKFSNNLSVVMEDPFDDDLKEQIKSITGFNVDPLISSQHSIEVALDKYYPLISSEDTRIGRKTVVDDINPSGDFDIKSELPQDDDIDSILGFDKNAAAPSQKRVTPQETIPQPVSNVSLDNVVAPEIATLSKQQKILKERLDNLKGETVKLINSFNKMKDEITTRFGTINKYFTKLKPLEGKYDMMLDGMKSFFKKYTVLLQEIKTTKKNLLEGKVEINNIKENVQKDLVEAKKMKTEYDEIVNLVEQEREKIKAGIRDRKLNKLLQTRIFQETYVGEDIKKIKQDAKKIYQQNLIWRNILIGLIVVLLGINIFFLMSGKGIGPTKASTTVKKEKKVEKPKEKEPIKEPVKTEPNKEEPIPTVAKTEPVPVPETKPEIKPEPKPEPKPVPKPEPKPVPKPKPKPVPKPKPKPKPKPIVYVYRIKIYSSANKPEIEDYKATLEGIPNMYVRKYSGKY
ncbi:hypothetical protein J7L48_01180, partial [bacterium]|nr:hypothetical protein [bacterium]